MSLRQQLEHDIDFAFVEFGMSEETFLRQTPREWQRRMLAWAQREARANRRVARLCTVLAWCHGDTSATEDRFMPKPVEDDDDEQTVEDHIAILGAIAPGGIKHG